MGARPRRQPGLDADADDLIVRAFPFGGFPGSQDDAPTTTTDDNAISTSIALDNETTETLNGSGDTLSLVVVSTQYGAEPVTSYEAVSSSLPTTTSALETSTPASTSTTARTSTATTPTHDAASAGATTSSAMPAPIVTKNHDNGLSSGELAAAIVVPIVVVLVAAFFLIFFCFRRRRQQARGERDGSMAAGFIPASMKEKWSSMRTSSASGQQQPVVMNTRNNAYNTGLDTSSHGSGNRSQQHSGEYSPRRSEGGTFASPPPPYSGAPVLPQMRQSAPLSMALDIPRSPAPQNTHDVSPLSQGEERPSAAALLGLSHDPPQPSSRSARSITSTLYSDTASVHSARAARMSVGGPSVIQAQTSRSMSGSAASGDGEDPFDTEANSPVTPLSERD